MSTPKLVHAAVELSRAAGASIGEDPGLVQVAGRLTGPALAAWQSVLEGLEDWAQLECIDSIGDAVAPSDIAVGDDVRIRLTFAPPAGAAYLLTAEGWVSFLLDDEAMAAVTAVRLGFDGAHFSTRGFDVAPWRGAPKSAPQARHARDTGPRRQVRCQSPDIMAPSAIEPYIGASSPESASSAWDAWADVACMMISRSISNELYRDGGVNHAALSGQPPRRLTLGSKSPSRCHLEALTRAANWVYLSGPDVEVRHTFLTGELAREWPSGASFNDGVGPKLAVALDSAELLYKAHLRGGAKDTLKSLADLRKSLVDDVTKLVQQSRDLANGVWRDVAVAIGVIAVRFGLDAAKAAKDEYAFTLIFALVAAYVWLSFRISVAINDRYLTSMAASREAFRSKLYAYLDDVDYEVLAEKPIIDSVANYRAVERRTRWIVRALIAALVAAAIFEGRDNVADAVRVTTNWISGPS